LADVPNRLREAIEAHYAKVRSRFAFLVNDAATAEDLAQEVFARFWEICLVQGEPRDVRAFIRGVERLVFLEFLRGKGRRSTMADIDVQSPPDPMDTPSERAEQADTLGTLRALLGSLEPEEQWLIKGRHFFEMTGQELSDSSGIPRRTLVDRYNRAMEKLRVLAIQRGLDL
jgi:RNA polymerase sigma factor (sigma-70 family)